MKNRLSSIVAAALIVSATAAFGAVKEGQFSISPVVGGYTFDKWQDLETSPVYGLRGGYNFTKRFGIEALFDYANTEQVKNGKGLQGDGISMYRYGGELLYHMWPDNNFVPYLAAGYAGLNFNDDKTRGAFDYGLGAKLFLNDNFALRGDVRHIFFRSNNNTYNNIEYTIGAHIPFGGAAPAVQPVAQPVVPPPPPMPEPAKIVPPAPAASLSISPATIVKSDNAAATLSWTSRNADTCFIQPEIGKVEPQGSRSISPSTDTTYKLTCSGAGGEATSSANIGVTLPPPPKPAPAPVVESAQKAAAAERFCNKPAVVSVLFDTDKADIKPQYTADLNTLGEFLKDFPNSKGEISGHTDNVGKDKYNLKLSQRRADSVKKYIENTFSIAPDRITTKGYGESKPIASNKTKAGKAQNRRIETNFSCE